MASIPKQYNPGDLVEANGLDPITRRPGANSSLPAGTHTVSPLTPHSNRVLDLASHRTRTGQRKPSAGSPLGADR